ncbi:MAG: peptide chain release factor N(5)-glutamine methyltransferase [Oscillospiraceae bacterium]|nr:peptide chain release factor N(5)-glutamine methyltransferase [Oscillospiraceae bacterium]
MRDIYNKIKNELTNAGVFAPAFEAFIIIKYIFNKNYIDLRDEDITDNKIKKLKNIINKRKTGYPLQYILGQWEFWGLVFKIKEGVLIPRSDTEVLVETALLKIKNIKNPEILDLCSGSGCVAISLAKERPDARVVAIEKSKIAYSCLIKNIELNKTSNVEPILEDILKIKLNQDFDLIISNPPYIKTNDIDKLQREVKFEPVMALDGGVDGLYFYKNILNNFINNLKKDGILMFEVGDGQAGDVLNLFNKKNFYKLETKQDINKINRIVFGLKK